MKANELRIGNWLIDKRLGKKLQFKSFYSLTNVETWPEDFEPIPLTPEILEKAGFYQLPHFTIQDSWMYDLGRGRVLSIGCVGTPNEIVFINEEEPPVVKNIIVARNYDYDGKTYLHHIQNLYFALTGTDLQIDLKTNDNE